MATFLTKGPLLVTYRKNFFGKHLFGVNSEKLMPIVFRENFKTLSNFRRLAFFGRKGFWGVRHATHRDWRRVNFFWLDAPPWAELQRAAIHLLMLCHWLKVPNGGPSKMDVSHSLQCAKLELRDRYLDGSGFESLPLAQGGASKDETQLAGSNYPFMSL